MLMLKLMQLTQQSCLHGSNVHRRVDSSGAAAVELIQYRLQRAVSIILSTPFITDCS